MYYNVMQSVENSKDVLKIYWVLYDVYYNLEDNELEDEKVDKPRYFN